MSTALHHHDWHIVGNGAVGMTIAWHLHNAGQSVCLITRAPGPDPVQLTWRLGSDAPRAWSCPTRHEPLQGMSISRLLVATKASSVAEVLETWGPTLADGARVIFMQNGRDFLPDEDAHSTCRPIYVVNRGIAAFRTDANNVVQTANLPAWIGESGGGEAPSHPDIADDLRRLNETDLQFEWSGEIEAHRWRKVAANAVINPLTVIFDCRNGEVLGNPEAKRLLDGKCREAADLLKALGFLETEHELRDMIERILDATSENISSMLQDYRSNAKQHELDFILGPMLREGRKRGLEMTVHQEVDRRVRARFKARNHEA